MIFKKKTDDKRGRLLVAKLKKQTFTEESKDFERRNLVSILRND